MDTGFANTHDPAFVADLISLTAAWRIAQSVAIFTEASDLPVIVDEQNPAEPNDPGE